MQLGCCLTMKDRPPFHQTGDPDGHFFALAFARGRYVSPSGSANLPASLVLYFSNSADFAPFSLATVSSDGQWLSSHTGDRFLRTVEYALLRAADKERGTGRSLDSVSASQCRGPRFPRRANARGVLGEQAPAVHDALSSARRNVSGCAGRERSNHCFDTTVRHATLTMASPTTRRSGRPLWN